MADPLGDLSRWLKRLLRLEAAVRDRAIRGLKARPAEDLARVAEQTEGDVIYALDKETEETLVPLLEEIGREEPFLFVGEGVNRGEPAAFPAGTEPARAPWRLLMDPIDGTRGLMYGKRSAWVLAGLAPNRGDSTSLADIALAVQTEIPTPRSRLSDVLWAERGAGARAETVDLSTGERRPFRPRPSRSPTVAHGFAMLSRFFPGGKEILARIEEELVEALFGPPDPRSPILFEDQYISTAGQLFEIASGRDRFNADLRGLLYAKFSREGRPAGHACHPYDLSAVLIAQEAGVIVTDGRGERLDGPLDTRTDLSWIGYANDAIRREVEPALLRILRAEGLLEEGKGDG